MKGDYISRKINPHLSHLFPQKNVVYKLNNLLEIIKYFLKGIH